jgi:outer membrane protein
MEPCAAVGPAVRVGPPEASLSPGEMMRRGRPGSRGWPGRVVATVVLAAAACVPIAVAAQAPEDVPPVLTLDRAIELALEHAPAAVAAEAAASVARADLLQSRGALIPSVGLTSIYNNSSNQRFDQATGQLVSESYTAQVSSSYELFAGGRRLANLRAAGAALDAAEARHREQSYGVVLRATETYYAAAAASDLVAVADQRLERARQQEEFAANRYELGTATTSDLLRAQIEVANAELAARETRSDLRTASLELGRLVGRAGEVRPAEAALPERAPALAALDELVERALHSSPAVLAADAVRDSRRADRLAAYTPYIPSLRVTGGYDWFSFDFPPQERSWSLRLTASLPVFNGFQREAAVARARALERAAEAQARDAAIAIRVAVEAAVQDIELADHRVQVSDRTVELAREDLRVQEERYQIGAATILDLQASQVTLAEAEVAAVRARQLLGGAIARLEAVFGETLGEE